MCLMAHRSKVFLRQRQRLGGCPKRADAAGPAGAAPVALRALNSRSFSATSWATGAGIAFDLAVGGPDWMRTLARRDFVNVRLEEWSRQKDRGPEGLRADRRPRGFWMAFLRLLLAPKGLAKRWTLAGDARAAFRSPVIGGQWSQARLRQYGHTDDAPTSVLHGLPRDTAPQTLALPLVTSRAS